MASETSDKETGRAIFALYARAVAAFQSGEALLPLAKEKAGEALALLASLPGLTPEQQCIQAELTEYMEKSGCW